MSREIDSRDSSRAATLTAAGAAASGAGGALVAVASAACCAGPGAATLIVTVLGAGGAAWAAGLRPYGPWLLLGSAVMILFGFRSTRSATACARAQGGHGLTLRLARGLVWAAAVLWCLAVGVQVRAWTGGGLS